MSKFHYKLSPSSTDRWMNCPGSLALSEGIPRQESVYAAEGTAAHAVGEDCLKTGKRACMVSEHVDEELATCINVYLDDIARARDAYNVIVEHTERTIKSTNIENFGGTQDHLMIYLDGEKLVCHVWDYKHGVGVVVDAEDNLQALSYFAIIKSNYLMDFDEFRITIVQPRSFSEEKIKYWACDAPRVDKHIDDIRSVIGKDHLNAGDWCRWCPATEKCPELRQHVKRIASLEFSQVEDDLDALLELQRVDPAVRKLLDRVPGMLLDLYRRSSDGIPGYKVVENLSNREWSNEETVIQTLRDAGLSDDAIYEKSLLGPAKIEKIVKDKKLIDSLTYRIPTSRKLVPVTHKGKAVDLKDVSEFSDERCSEEEDN